MQVAKYARDFQLNAGLASSIATASTLISLVLFAAFGLVAWLNDIHPFFVALHKVYADTTPLIILAIAAFVLHLALGVAAPKVAARRASMEPSGHRQIVKMQYIGMPAGADAVTSTASQPGNADKGGVDVQQPDSRSDGKQGGPGAAAAGSMPYEQLPANRGRCFSQLSSAHVARGAHAARLPQQACQRRLQGSVNRAGSDASAAKRRTAAKAGLYSRVKLARCK